jgi:phosphatidylglycerophosphate synthase
MKSVANYISISRIVISIALLITKPLSPVFLSMYLIIGLSDILDGYIARKTYSTSKLGEKLDSMADMIFDVILIIILYPVVNPGLLILIWIVIVAIIRITAVGIVYIKYKTFGMVHTLANKGTGFILFLFPIFYTAIQSDILIYFICIIATVSAIEELFIDLLSNEWQANRKSIFVK